jgi:oligopeptide transport system ATP-binding protein
MTERILEVNDLHVSFDISAGEVQAVRGVDFYLNKGIYASSDRMHHVIHH